MLLLFSEIFEKTGENKMNKNSKNKMKERMKYEEVRKIKFKNKFFKQTPDPYLRILIIGHHNHNNNRLIFINTIISAKPKTRSFVTLTLTENTAVYLLRALNLELKKLKENPVHEKTPEQEKVEVTISEDSLKVLKKARTNKFSKQEVKEIIRGLD